MNEHLAYHEAGHLITNFLLQKSTFIVRLKFRFQVAQSIWINDNTNRGQVEDISFPIDHEWGSDLCNKVSESFFYEHRSLYQRNKRIGLALCLQSIGGLIGEAYFVDKELNTDKLWTQDFRGDRQKILSLFSKIGIQSKDDKEGIESISKILYQKVHNTQSIQDAFTLIVERLESNYTNGESRIDGAAITNLRSELEDLIGNLNLDNELDYLMGKLLGLRCLIVHKIA